MLGVLLVFVTLLVATPARAISDAWVKVETPEGRAILGFRPELKPYTGEEQPRVTSHFSDRQPTDKKGRVISGAGFYGWEADGTIHIVVLILVPDPDAENRFYADPEDRRLRYEVLSRLALKPGEARQTEELTALYGREMTLRVGKAN
jgi:hypothetical protein